MSIGDARLVDLIHQTFDAGTLPHEHPKTLWRSYGMGDACTGCGDPMGRGQGVFEIDTARKTYRFHHDCYGLCEGELIRRGLVKPQ
jgi:hypothetical protein